MACEELSFMKQLVNFNTYLHFDNLPKGSRKKSSFFSGQGKKFLMATKAFTPPPLGLVAIRNFFPCIKKKVLFDSFLVVWIRIPDFHECNPFTLGSADSNKYSQNILKA